MRILAIRGRNLASLADDFEVDFTREPLAGAGVFAICGPTGAGKSTLLDALCLALYHEVPRLRGVPESSVNLPDVSGLTVPTGNPRTLLRRGCSEGFAEVDFVGVDGSQWRARWVVRRARNKVDGRLQNAEASLTQIGAAAPITTQVSETKEAIATRIGLTFDQFRRAVLLAQNDFAALLKARGEDRAGLLEALTDTHIFGDVSQLAHKRWRQEAQQLDEHRKTLGTLTILAPEERAQLERSIATASAQLEQLQSQQQGREAELQWHDEGIRLAAAVAEAERETSRRSDAITAGSAERRQLDLWHALTGLRARFQEYRGRESAVQQLAEKTTQLEADLEACDRRLIAAGAAIKQSSADLAAAERAAAQAAPAIERARELDVLLAQDQVQLAVAAKTIQASELELQNLKTEIGKLHAQAETYQDAQRAWLQWREFQFAGWQSVPDWGALGKVLADAVGAIDKRRGCDQELERCANELRVLGAQRSDAEAAHDAASDTHRQAEAALRTARTQRDAIDADAIERELDEHRTRLACISAAEQALEQFGTAIGHVAAADTRINQLAGEMVEIASRRGALRAELERAEHEFRAADTSFQRAGLAADVHTQRLREALVPGEACIVCGATEHPMPHQTEATVADVLATLRDDRDRAEAGLTKVRKEQARLDVLGERLAQDHKDAVADRERARAAVDPCRARLTEALEPLEVEPAGVEAGGVPSMAAALAQRRTTEIEIGKRLATRSEQRKSADRSVEDALKAVETTATQLESTRLAVEAIATQERPLLDAQSREKTRAATHEHAISLALEWIRSARGASLQSEPEAETLHKNWAEGDALREAAEAVVELQSAVEHALADHKGRAEEKQRALDDARIQFERQRGESAQRADARRRVLAEPDVNAYAARLAEAVNAARERNDRAVKEQAECERDRDRVTHDLVSTRELHATRSAELGASTRSLEEALDALRTDDGPDVPTLDQLHAALAAIPDDLAARRDAWRLLDEELGAMRMRLRERRDQVAEWERRRGDRRDRDVVQAEHATVAQEIERLRNQRADDEAKRKSDDAVQNHRVREAEQLMRAEAAARRWQILDDLIGSADGKKFKTYAQQITLEALLAYANQHLDRLAPRYQLRCGTEPMSLLVEDRDFGDELRSVYSLSGGESFLVSLGLALGLASLSAEKVQVESLFIDEGFGSLDAETLNSAMEALDRLQAEGRRVGVISHVHDMAERIGVQVRVEPIAPGRSRVRAAR